jgi:nucleotide-binding universal stress UspA family protein
MRALLGIDDAGTYDVALGMIAKLGFPNLQATLLHCVESVLPDGSFPAVTSGHVLAQMIDEREAAGRETLKAAQEKLASLGVTAETRIEQGSPSVGVLRVADEIGADLIMVGCSNKGRWGTLFFGSVSQAVVTGSRRHLAVVKTVPPEDRPLKAVFATDHSEYANRCLEALLELAPKGIGELHVLTANEVDAGTAAMLVRGMPDLAGDAEGWIAEKLLERNRGVASRFQAIGIEAAPLVINGHPNEAIRQAMEETGADLLILGAQGHGFIERLTVGSVSFYQAVSEKHSVLILRP